MEKFLGRNFEMLYGRSDQQWIDAALESLESERDLIASDFLLRFPQADTGSKFVAELVRTIETDAALLGTLLYRLERGIFLRNQEHVALSPLASFMRFRTGMEIYYSTEIGPRFRVTHGQGLVIGPRYKIGTDFSVYQGVTLGQRRNFSGHETLTIGDRCQIFSGAKVIGDLRIGDDVCIGANAVLLHDALESGTYVGAPARKVR